MHFPQLHRMVACCFVCLFAVHLASPLSAVTIDHVLVGDLGNKMSTTARGSVSQGYSIGKYEVTNSQYADFLNAVAKSDPNGLYDTEMATGLLGQGGIVRTGVDGSYAYQSKAGFGNKPVIYTSFYDALRFVNWLQNGQPSGPQNDSTTEDGSYTITASAIVNNSLLRNPHARVFLPSQDEWYKAAFYKGGGIDSGYWSYATSSDSTPLNNPPPGGTNSANYHSGTFGTLKDVGAYSQSIGPYGTYDQAGSVWEWTEGIIPVPTTNRLTLGGSWLDAGLSMQRDYGLGLEPTEGSFSVGFRVAFAVPEPATLLFVIPCAIVFASRRFHRRQQ